MRSPSHPSPSLMRRYRFFAPAVISLTLLACNQTAEGNPAISPQDAFMDNLRAHCEQAFPGRLVQAPEGDEMLEGSELLVVHFRECGEEEVKLPFHIESLDGSWDRSRTWVFTQHEGEIELRHDHRLEDGSEDEVTWYGAFSDGEGTPNRQEFLLPPDDRPTRGWRVEIEPGERYTYGTIREGEWSWRVDFDLSESIDPPPPPWGHDTEPSRVPYPL